MYVLHDDIVALATLPGKSALNVIRLSGKNLNNIYKKITKRSRPPKARYVHSSHIYNCLTNRKIDFVLITYFKAPKSYTGEDILEISTHGGSVIAKQTLETIMACGARQALPGEFTYRAYINGKVNLLQAEAIASIVEANNSLDSYYRLNAMGGDLTENIKKNKLLLTSLITLSEHELDFLDSEIDKQDKNEYLKQLKIIYNNTNNIIKKSISSEQQTGNIGLAIIGNPNAGKSSLFNYLVGKQKSIITEIKGTTRDSIESNVCLGKNDVKIVDTAGIRATKNIVEIKGIENTYKHIEESEIIIIIDEKNARKSYQKDIKLFSKKTVVLVNNKSDINSHIKENNVFSVSCKTQRGLDKLLTYLSTLCSNKTDIIYKQASYSINIRQKKLLHKICVGINKAMKALKDTGDLTICLSLLYQTHDLYNELISPDSKNKIINKIFEGFCVGK